MSKNSYPQFVPSYPHSTRSYPHFNHSYPHFKNSYPQKPLSYPQLSSSYPQFFRFVLQNHSTYDIIILFRLYAQSINPALLMHISYHFSLFPICFPVKMLSLNRLFPPGICNNISYMILYIIHYIVMIARYNTIYSAYYDVRYV